MAISRLQIRENIFLIVSVFKPVNALTVLDKFAFEIHLNLIGPNLLKGCWDVDSVVDVNSRLSHFFSVDCQ